MAVSRRPVRDGQPEADFFRVTTWDKLAEICKPLTKGKKVSVVGPVSVSTYKAQDGTFRASLDIMAQDVEFLSPKEQKQDSTKNDGFVEVEGDDLPF